MAPVTAAEITDVMLGMRDEAQRAILLFSSLFLL